MAIFGTLAEMPLPELLRTLERRTGKLSIEVLPQKSDYSLYLNKTRLRAMYVGNEILGNGILIRQAVTELSEAKQGNYIFKSISEEALPKSCDIELAFLLLNIANTDTDEITRYKNRLPAAKTYFKRSNWQSVKVWPSKSLKTFWERTASWFTEGCSAEKVARELNLDVNQVRLNFYKLRSLRQISPVRSFESTSPAVSSASSFEGKLPPLDSSITAAMQQRSASAEFVKNISNMSYQEILKSLAEKPASPSIQKQKQELAPVQVQKKLSKPLANQKGLVDRLLKALSKRK